MKWISVKERPPIKEDSPILACNENYGISEYLNCAALHWLDDENGWDGAGWYGHRDEYGMKEKHITHWMPLPLPPGENNE